MSGSLLDRPRVARSAALGAVVTAVAVALLVPTQGRASHLQPGMSISIGSPVDRVSGVYLSVPVQVTCPVPPPLTAIVNDSIIVNVTQKTGKTLAFGSGGFGFNWPAPTAVNVPVTCDATAHTYTINVFPSVPDSGPFRIGQAVATASFTLGVGDPSCPFCGVTDFNAVSSGPQSIRVSR